MYYEEKMIDGVLHYRSTPQGEWEVKEADPPPSGKESVEELALKVFPYTNEGNVEDDIDAAKRRIWIAGYTEAKAATPDSREDGYWQKRCEAAEALIKKHYKSIPDSPTYMAWQNSIEPDSREEGKGEEVPRRIRIDLMAPAEKAITDAMYEVEKMPADTRITDAVIMLAHARNKVADFIDGVESK